VHIGGSLYHRAQQQYIKSSRNISPLSARIIQKVSSAAVETFISIHGRNVGIGVLGLVVAAHPEIACLRAEKLTRAVIQAVARGVIVFYSFLCTLLEYKGDCCRQQMS
jgi:hypothetical protein